VDRSDDLSSLGLEAFHEAILSFEHKKGSNFFSFATLVIRRRAIDHIRREKKISATSFDDRESENGLAEGVYAENSVSLRHFRETNELEYRREEIFHYQEQLAKYGIDFSQLPDHSPKHDDARKTAISIAKIIIEHKQLKDYLLEKKRLPIQELLNIVSVSRKTVERHRIYIIAITVLLMEDYQYLHQYLNLGGE
jgi:RNA polymerase sigma factor